MGDNIGMDIIRWKVVDWIHVSQYMLQ